MEHTLHFSLKACIEEICPTPSWYKKKKPQKAEEDDEFEEDDEEWDCEVTWLANLVNDAPAAEGEAIDEDMDYCKSGQVFFFYSEPHVNVNSRCDLCHKRKHFSLQCALRRV